VWWFRVIGVGGLRSYVPPILGTFFAE
jgi:hypothetical protein